MTAPATAFGGCSPARGFSDEAMYLAHSRDEGRKRLQQSFALGLAGTAVFDELFAVWEECNKADWDGHGAMPVTQDSWQRAYCLLRAIPPGIHAPTVGAEPDGHITLEWYRSPRRTLSLSVSPEGDLHYAALLGPNRAYGTEAFFGDVPSTILSLICRVHSG